MIKKYLLGLIVIFLCVTIGAAQSKRKSSAEKSAVVTYEYDAPYEHWRYGGIYLKINGVVKRFEWGDFTRFDKSILDNPTAREKKGAEWRITYSVDTGGGYSLLSASFTGRITNITGTPNDSSPTMSAKTWVPFWTRFKAAIRTRNRPAIKSMALQQGFEGNTETVGDWLRNVDSNNWWHLLQASVETGSRSYQDPETGRPAQATQDGRLHFVYTKSGWRFAGPTPPE